MLTHRSKSHLSGIVGQFAVAAVSDRRNLLNQKPPVRDRRYSKPYRTITLSGVQLCSSSLRPAHLPSLRCEAPPYADMVRTTRYSALPLIILSYASLARSNGYFSIMGRTPLNTAKLSVSSESVAVPEGQP